MIVLETAKNYLILGLALWAVGASVATWGYQHKADAAEARVEPLESALADAIRVGEGFRAAQQACVAESIRVRKANEAAVRDAQRAKEQADAKREAFDRKLDAAPEGCAEILEAKVCPALLDY